MILAEWAFGNELYRSDSELKAISEGGRERDFNQVGVVCECLVVMQCSLVVSLGAVCGVEPG